MDFSGQTVLVTGAAHGIGRAIVCAFAARGAKVWACDVLERALGETKAAGRAVGGQVETALVDVTDPAAVEGFVGRALEAEGALHVLVNNAGGVQGQTGRPVEEVSAADWRAVFAVNTDAAFYFARAVALAMKHAGGGRIVTVSSGAGLGVSLTGIQAYAAAKAAQIGLTRQLAHELGPYGVTVNAVAPGFVLSNPATERQWASYGSEGQRKLVNGIALRRLGTPEDIAHGVLFFASPYAAWVTGETLRIDGGR